MATEAIHKLEPRRTLSLRGFDRRGAAAAITASSATGFKVSGAWSDQVDFAVLVLFDQDDVFGHLQTTKYLPDTSLQNVVLDFDLAISGCQHPTSFKFQSVGWGALNYYTPTATSFSTIQLQPLATSATGMVAASCTYTVNGAPAAFDRVSLVYLGNVAFDYIVSAGDTAATVAAAMSAAVNGANWTSLAPTTALMATASGATFTVTAARYGKVNTSGTAVTLSSGQNFLGSNNGDTFVIAGVAYTISTVNSPTSITLTASAGTQTAAAYLAPGGGRDGNSIQIQELHKNANTYLTPAGASKLTGGADPTSTHFKIDFTALGADSLRQAWLTFAPALNYDSGGTNPALVAYSPSTWSATFSNWALTDPSTVLPLKIAGPGSVIVDSRNTWAKYAGAGWSQQAGFYFGGFARVSPTSSDSITITYSCQSPHDLMVGTSLSTDRGIFSVTLDGVAQADLDMYLNVGSPLQTRRRIAAAVGAGSHTVVLTVKASHNVNSAGTNCYFDYLQAAVLADVQDAPTTYSGVGLAFDFDTDQTYKLPPQRSIWIAQRAGFVADIDFYAGVFFALKRIRSGGTFHSATVTISAGGGFNTGTGFGDGDAMFITIGGTSFGVAVYPADTLTTLAQRFVDGVNATFVGVRAALGSAGVFTVTVLSPINGFALSTSFSNFGGSTGTITVTGDIGISVGGIYVGGQEGTWQVDSGQTSPLNQAFSDFMADFCSTLHASGQTCTVAFSQELLNPPDTNTSAGAWSQRFADGATVLTATGFGSWGAGFVESVASGPPITIAQTAHGYITGNTVHIAGAGSGVWSITVTDANHYQLTTLISGGYTPAAGDAVLIDLQTTQCAFNPSTVTPYLSNVYKQTAGIMNAAGLTPWLQFGEILHWFFSERMSQAVGYASFAAPISIGTVSPHGFTTGQTVIIAGVKGNTAANGTWPITVVDSTHFTLTGSSGNGTYVASTGTASGGGMAFYDANQAAAATSALGRALASFYTQDDDPTINSSADANFLASRIKTHVDSIRTAVLAVYAGAKFELLYPNDVTFLPCYYTPDLPYPQGGRLNHTINLPSAWLTKSGSGLDRFKAEALSWGATYRNMDNSKATAAFPYTAPLSWAKSDSAYLVPIFNGGCPWKADYLQASNKAVPLIVLWAFDHLNLLSWPVPLPKNKRRAFVS